MEAIILAGGLGTRLKSVVSDLPKPMASINGKPFLEYLLTFLQKNGVDRVILSVGYMQEAIIKYFGSKYNKIDIIYARELAPLGTGGAVRNALQYCEQENVIILNGDTFFNVNINALMMAHCASSSVITLAIKRLDVNDRYGSVKIKDGIITSFGERGDLINGGIYIVNKNIEKFFDNALFSFENDFLKQKIADIKPFAFVGDDYFIDIGIPIDYERAQKELNDYF